MTVTAFARCREAGDDDVGLEAAKVPHHVGQDRVVAPDGQRFLRRFGVAEVEGAREVLFTPIDASRGKKLLRAQNAEELAFLVADEVLSAVTARHRQVASAQQPLVREVGDER